MHPPVRQVLVWQVMLVCVIIMVICLSTGIFLIKRGLASGSIPPLMLCFVGGILIGISMLVVLPETVDTMGAWPTERIFLIFVSAIVFMFFIDHCVLEHDHSHGSNSAPGCTDDNCTSCDPPPPAVTKEEEVSAPPAKPALVGRGCLLSGTPAVSGELAIDGVPVSVDGVPVSPRGFTGLLAEACEEPSGEVVDVDVEAGTKQQKQQPIAEPIHVVGKAGGALESDNCDCLDCVVEPGVGPFGWVPRRQKGKGKKALKASGLGGGFGMSKEGKSAVSYGTTERTALLTTKVGTPGDVDGTAGNADGSQLDAEVDPSLRQTCFSVFSTTMRLFAWLLHGMLDGMVLSSASSLSALIAVAIPVGICSIQDVAAFTVSMGAHGLSPNAMMMCVVCFALAFPCGAGLALQAYTLSSNQDFIGVVRAFVAGVFVYMALFEMAPPHAHGRWVNAKYLGCFILGALCAYSAELIEDLSESFSTPAGAKSATMLLQSRLW